MSDPTVDNTTANYVNSIIARGNSLGAKVVISLATAKLPFLGWPVIRTLFAFLVGWLSGFMSKAEQEGATFVIIDAQISTEESALARAVVALAAAQKSGDKNAIQKAVKAYADAHSALVHYDGAAPPK